VETLAKLNREKLRVVFLALIITGGKQTSLNRDELLEILRAMVLDRKIGLRDRLKAVQLHSRWLGYKLTEGEMWSVISAIANGETE
jgi:hypothetical protein